MEKKKNFSKAEEKKLFICRERVYDAIRRVKDMAEVMNDREMDGSRIGKYLPTLNKLHDELQIMEKENYISHCNIK